MGDQRRELACLVQAGAQQARDLLDDRLRGQERGVLLRELLDQLLVLVKLLQSLDVHRVDADRFRFLTVLVVSEDADLHLRARREGELDGPGETLVLLRVVVLEADLELDGLGELALLLGRGLEDAWKVKSGSVERKR